MYPVPENEQERLNQLWQYRVVGSEPEAQFNHIAELASALFEAPISVISFVDADRLWLKAHVGLNLCETPRDIGFCAHTIMRDHPLVVPDLTKDDRFATNPLVQGASGIRFYVGVPLIVAGGHRVGTLCIMDKTPRPAPSSREMAQLKALASFVVDRLELRRLQFVNMAVRGFADATAEAMLCIDERGVLTFVNRAALSLFGYSADEMIGQKADMIVPERFREAHAAGVARVAEGTASKLAGKIVELSAVRRGGEEFPVEMGICVWRNQAGTQMGALLRDISERKERDLRLHRMASQDALTGLANRLQFERVLAEAFASGTPVAALLLDLDNFKSVNDSLGHAAGDALLQALSIRLNATLEADAVLARIGGDEFAVVLPGTGDPLRVADCAGAILAGLTAPFCVLGHTIQIGISIGAAIGPNHGCDAEELVASADLALYRAKADGRRRFRFYEPAMRNAIRARRALQDELLRAVKDKEFVLHYQPQVDLTTKRVIGAEALLRWQHPQKGLLLPNAFVPALETHVLAAEVGNWVLNEACRQAAVWRDMGLPRLRMGVNLFAAQIRSGLLLRAVAAALSSYGIAPDTLELEITETIALQNDDAVLAPLREVHSLGVGLAFDDFGTGYASLSTLKRVPLTTLKIDRSFVCDLQPDTQDAAVVEAMVGMGRRLGLCVIAEGIETAQQEAVLVDLGCRAGQGFRYGRPMTGNSFSNYLREREENLPLSKAV